MSLTDSSPGIPPHSPPESMDGLALRAAGIQPHAAVLVVDETGTIRARSSNADRLLALTPEITTLHSILPPQIVQSLGRGALAEANAASPILAGDRSWLVSFTPLARVEHHALLWCEWESEPLDKTAGADIKPRPSDRLPHYLEEWQRNKDAHASCQEKLDALRRLLGSDSLCLLQSPELAGHGYTPLLATGSRGKEDWKSALASEAAAGHSPPSDAPFRQIVDWELQSSETIDWHCLFAASGDSTSPVRPQSWPTVLEASEGESALLCSLGMRSLLILNLTSSDPNLPALQLRSVSKRPSWLSRYERQLIAMSAQALHQDLANACSHASEPSDAEIHNEQELLSLLASEIVDWYPGIIYCLDSEGRIAWSNRHFDLLVRRSNLAVRGMRLESLFPSDVARLLSENDRHARKQRGPIQCEEVMWSARTVPERFLMWKFPLACTITGSSLVCSVGIKITERARSLLDLRQQMKRLEQVSETAPVMLWMADAQQGCFYVNRTWKLFTGRSLLDETGSGWWEDIHPDDRPAALDCWNRALVERLSFRHELRLRRHDGNYRLMQWQGEPQITPADSDATSSPHWGPRRESVYYTGSCTDITLLRSAIGDAELWRSACEAAGGVAFEVGSGGVIQSWSRRAEQLFGYHESQALLSPLSLLAPRDPECVVQIKSALVGHEPVDDLNGLWTHREEQPINVSITLLPHPLRVAGADRALVVVSDRTRQVQLEEDLASAQFGMRSLAKRLQTILDCSPDSIVAFDHDLKVEVFNQRFCDEFRLLYGFEPERGASIIDIFAADAQSLPLTQTIVEKALGGEIVSIEQEYGPPNRLRRLYEIQITPLFGPDHHIDGAVSFARNISERRRAIANLQLEESRLNRTLAASGLVVWEWNLREDRMYWDGDLDTLFGAGYGAPPVTFEDLLGRITLQGREKLESQITGLVTKGEELRTTFHIDDEQEREIGLRCHMEREGGQPSRITGVWWNNQPISTAVRDLRESEARFRSAFDDAIIGMALVSTDGRFIRVNRSLCEIVGYSESEMLTLTFQKLTHPDDLSLDLEHLRDLVDGHISGYQMEKRYFHSLGHLVWILLSVSMVRDEAGKPLYCVSQIQDISERKAASEALRKSEERLELAIRGSSDGIWDWRDLDTDEVWLSPKVYELLDYAPGSTPGNIRWLWDQFHPDDRKEIDQSLEFHLKGGTPFDAEARVMGADGEYRWIRLRGGAIRDERGRPTRMAGVMTDISEKKRREEELRRWTQELQRVNEELDSFAYVASHDLKAPLRGIANGCRWLFEDVGSMLPEKSQRHLSQMRARTQRMEKLLDDLLDYSRVGRINQEPEVVETDKLIREVYKLLMPSFDCELLVGPEMPTLLTHRVPLDAVFRNLVDNAIKFGTNRPLRIETMATIRQSEVEFAVSDNGPGIPPEYHERIFQMFQTLAPRDQIEGSGMGLAMVKKVVESQGGRIRVESEPGRGTTFRFTWPRRPSNLGDLRIQ